MYSPEILGKGRLSPPGVARQQLRGSNLEGNPSKHRHSCVPGILARRAFLADGSTHTGAMHLCETRGLGQNSYARVIMFNTVMPPAGLCIACFVRLATCVWLPDLCCLGWVPLSAWTLNAATR